MEPNTPVAGETAAAAAAAPGSEYLLVIEGDRSWTVTVPPDGELTIGRDPSSGLVLGDAAVSRNHAQLLLVPEGLRATDLGSRHGTLVNGERLVQPRIVVSGDIISLGETVLIVRVRRLEP